MIVVETLDLVDQYLLDRRSANDRLAKCFLLLTRFNLNHGPGTVDIELLLDKISLETVETLKDRKARIGRVANAAITRKDQIEELKEGFSSFLRDHLIPLAHLQSSIDYNCAMMIQNFIITNDNKK